MFALSILTILFQVLVLFLKKTTTIKGQKQLPKLDLIHIKRTENEYKNTRFSDFSSPLNPVRSP